MKSSARALVSRIRYWIDFFQSFTSSAAASYGNHIFFSLKIFCELEKENECIHHTQLERMCSNQFHCQQSFYRIKSLLSFTEWSLTLWISFHKCVTRRKFHAHYPLSIYWKPYSFQSKLNDSFVMSLIYSSIEEAISVWSCSCLIVVYSFRNTNLNFECAWPPFKISTNTKPIKWSRRRARKKMYERDLREFSLYFVVFTLRYQPNACVSSKCAGPD